MRTVLLFFSFHGRTRRRTYGALFLATAFVLLVFGASFFVAAMQTVGDDLLGKDTDLGRSAKPMLASLRRLPHDPVVWVWMASGIAAAIVTVAWIAVCVRRLHDMNMTGWIVLVFILLCILFPILGYLLVSLALVLWPGSKGANPYGPDPRVRRDFVKVFG